MTDLDTFDPGPWLGRSRSLEVRIDPFPAAAFAAALDREDAPGEGDPLPPFWHHLYTGEPVRAADTGADGHPRLGLFLPPVPLPRRMWAGGRLAVRRLPRIGQAVRRVSTIRAVTPKRGRSGALVFVLVEHRFSDEEGELFTEEQDIVYREPRPLATAAEPWPLPGPPAAERCWIPDEVLLFRYSALTYNGHRIHYDLAYAREVEGYPGLVVHGPLIATLMLDLLRDRWPGARLVRFAFRAVAPLFAGRPLRVAAFLGEGAEERVLLVALGDTGRLAMEGEAMLARP
ncbi:MAG TPA: acyl-CoA dehydrogenase [Rhodospirillales bacterium]|nr:acyl-CoA dehydrogenase [Rhodospirillales bacterium]